MRTDPVHLERLVSARTEGLFVVLTLVFLSLFSWRTAVADLDGWAVFFLAGAGIFLFYSINYRVLVVRLTQEALTLRFGLFTWTTLLDDIEACTADRTSLWRIGGAGIHFTFLGGRYRAMFNFLEYPRLVVRLARPRGPVRDIAFSTRRPDQVRRLIETRIRAKAA